MGERGEMLVESGEILRDRGMILGDEILRESERHWDIG